MYTKLIIIIYPIINSSFFVNFIIFPNLVFAWFSSKSYSCIDKMGKMKRQRSSLHAPAVRPPDVMNDFNTPSMDVMEHDAVLQFKSPRSVAPSIAGRSIPPASRPHTPAASVSGKSGRSVGRGGGGVFSKLDIDFETLTKRLGESGGRSVGGGSVGGGGDDFDVRSAVTSKSMRGMNLKKKEKKKLRHEIWLKKVDIIESRLKEERAKKKRQKTAVVGDLRPLHDTLPTLELLMRATGTLGGTKQARGDQASSGANKRKARSIEKESYQQKQMLADISLFNEVSEHPAYKADPLATIVEHLGNKMKQENPKRTK